MSKRGREVLSHLVGGRMNKRIAYRLGSMDHPVTTQVNRIHEKLEVRNRVDVFALAMDVVGSRNPGHEGRRARPALRRTANKRRG